MPTVSVVELSEEGQEIAQSEKTFEVDAGEIIFNALENQGFILPHGCLAGSCGSCRSLVLEGGENLSTQSIIEQNTTSSITSEYEAIGTLKNFEAQQIRLSCRARIMGGHVKLGLIK